MVIITRNIELKRIKASKGWILVYGRRKTGKSFLIENFVKWDKYFFVKRSGEIFEKTAKKTLNYSAFIPLLEQLLKDKKRIVIDEFHRLPSDFLDFLHINSGQGNLIAISSTLWLSKRLLEKDSPILGLFSEVPVYLIDERDILAGLKQYAAPEDLILLATYMREPLMLKYIRKAKPIDILTDYFKATKFLAPLLISSVFLEEDRDFTSIYEGVVRAVAGGRTTSKEITDFLYSQRLIPRPDHGYCQQYLHNLNKIGIIEKNMIFNSKKLYYSNFSPLIDMYFYMDEKYNFSEQELSDKQIKDIIQAVAPKHIEIFVRSLLAKVFELSKSKIVKSGLEIDIALCKFKKLQVVGEVKWRNRLSSAEIKAIEEKLQGFNCRKILVVPNNGVLERKPEGFEVITARDLIKLATS